MRPPPQPMSRRRRLCTVCSRSDRPRDHRINRPPLDVDCVSPPRTRAGARGDHHSIHAAALAACRIVRPSIKAERQSPLRAWCKASCCGKHVFRLHYRDVIGSLLPQKACERMNVLRGQCSVSMPEGRPAERRLDPETLLGLCKKGVITCGKPGAHLPHCARALLRCDPVEDDARPYRVPAHPFRLPRRDEARLRAQDDAILDHFQSDLRQGVEPVVVMSTISSAVPAAGAPSVAPELSTMR